MWKKATRRSRRGRVPSINEIETRRYHKDVREMHDKCNLLGIELKTYDSADFGDICVLSRNEFDVGEPRVNLEENNESYFVSCEMYDKHFNKYEE